MSAIDELRTAMRSAGINYDGPITADGKLHRIKAAADKRADTWYVLYADPPHAGAFGSWPLGVSQTWHSRGDGEPSNAQWATILKRWEDAGNARRQDEVIRHGRAAKIAERYLSAAGSADPAHPYLVRKHVRVHGQLCQHDDLLLLPLRDTDGKLHSVQFIAPDRRFGDGTRDKNYLADGRVTGCFFRLADNPDGPIVVCEGYATGASVHEATGHAVICAMHCGNLLAVSQAVRAKWPDRQIIVAADTDQYSKNNPGLSKARETANAIHAKLTVPAFKDISSKPTDFNDLHQLEGLDTVKEQIENPIPPSGSIATEYLGPEPAAERKIIVPPPNYRPPPLTLLPFALREYVLATAKSLGVDIALVFLPLLSSLAAAIGNSRNIRVKKGFVQPANVWTTIVARSGAKKSPALTAVTTFFCMRERQLLRLNAAAEAIFEKQHREWDALSKKARGEEPQPPPRLTCLLDDLTLAVIAPILRDNPRGALVAKDELASWFGSFGQFSKAPGGAAADVSGWLSLYNGERLLLDRKTNRESHRIFNPRLNITGCIPPAVLKGTLTQDFFQRGLPARICFAAPPPRPNVWTDAEVPDDVESEAAAIFDRLFALVAEERGDGPVPKELIVGPDGLEVYIPFYDRVGHLAIEAEEKEEAAWNKLLGVALRLALIGQLAHGLDKKPVGGPITKAAVELAEWFGHEAERIYASMCEPPGMAQRRRLFEFIQQRGGEVSVKEITDSFRPLKNKVADAEGLLNNLAAVGLGRWTPIETTTKGGRPTRKFRLLADTAACPRPLNPGISEENRGLADADTPGDAKPAGKELIEEFA